MKIFFRRHTQRFCVKLGNVYNSFDDIDRIVALEGRFEILSLQSQSLRAVDLLLKMHDIEECVSMRDSFVQKV